MRRHYQQLCRFQKAIEDCLRSIGESAREATIDKNAVEKEGCQATSRIVKLCIPLFGNTFQPFIFDYWSFDMDLRYVETIPNIPSVKIFPLESISDGRGTLTECFREDHILTQGHNPAMMYLSTTLPGQIRGPHEHKDQTDFFIFPGPGIFILHLWRYSETSEVVAHEKIVCGETNRIAVLIPPGVVHGYKCVSKGPASMINLPNTLWRGRHYEQDVDEIRHELDPDSPFKIE